MTDQSWDVDFAKSLVVYLNGEAISSPDARGERIVDQSFYIFFNAHYEDLPFVLPAASRWSASSWRTVPTRQFVRAARFSTPLHPCS